MTDLLRVALDVGDPAPTFTAPTTDGDELDLAELRGAPVLLFFVPYAFTVTCTGELRALRDRYAELTAGGTRVLALTCDTVFTLRTFAEAEGLPFPVASDFWPHGEIAEAYGVFDDQVGCALRASFLLDAEGRVAWSVVNQLGDARDVDDHLAAVDRLTGPAATG